MALRWGIPYSIHPHFASGEVVVVKGQLTTIISTVYAKLCCTGFDEVFSGEAHPNVAHRHETGQHRS
jgi:hypothetical protein